MKLGLVALIMLSVSFSSSAENSAAATYEKARQYQANQQLRQAELELRNSLQQDPNYLPARLLLGQLLLQTAQWPHAEKELQLALDGGAAPATVVFDLCRAMLAQNKTAETQHILEKYAELQQLPAGLLMQANVLLQQQQLGKAEALYQQALQGNLPTELADEIRLQQAELALRQQHYAHVAPILEQIKSSAFSKKAMYLRAQMYLQNQQASLALPIWQQLLQADAADPVALLGKARTLQQLGQLPQALAAIIAYREQYPDNPYGQLIHAALLGEQGDDKQQQRMLRQLQMQLSNLPNNYQEQEDVLILTASIDFKQQRLDSAVQHARRAAELYPQNPQIQQLLAQIQVARRDFSGAQKAISQAIVLNPAQYPMYLLGAYVARETKNQPLLKQFLTDAFQRFGAEPEVRRAYIQWLMQQGDRAQATALLANQMQATQADYVVLGYLQLEQGLLAEAQQTSARLLKDDQSKVEIFQLAGDVAAKNGDRVLAQQFFQQALVLDASYKPALLSLASLSLQQEDWAAVTGFYQRILEKDPSDSLTLQLMADASLKLGQPQQAITYLKQLASDDLKLFPARLALMELYLQTGQLTEAEQVAAELDPFNDVNADFYAARLRLALAQQKGAEINRLSDILYGLWFDYPKRLPELANMQLNARLSQQASRTIARLNVLKEPNLILQTRLALLEQHADKAQQLITQMRQQGVQSLPLDELQAQVFLLQNNPKAARPLLQKLYQQSQSQAHLVAYLHTLASEPTQLTAELKHWLQQHPHDLSATLALAEHLQRLGEQHAQVTLYQQSPLLKTEPVMQNNYANLLLKQDPKQALHYAQMAHQAMPEQADILDTYGFALVANGDLEQGLGLLRQAEIRQPQQVLIQLHIAVALTKLQRPNEAKPVLEKLAKLPSTTWTAEEQQLFAAIQSGKF